MIDEPAANKKCVFYYAMVVEGDGKTYRSTPGTRLVEPVTLNGDKHGNNPDFCCQAFREAYGEREMYVFWPDGKSNLDLNNRTVSFCPFCGATIEYKEHLKLRTVLTEQTCTDYKVQVIEGR